jgi:hypothetical protein
MEMVKQCKGCSQDLPLNLFSKSKVEKDGLQRRCKSCFSEYAKKNIQRMSEYQKVYKKVNRNSLLNRRRSYEAERNKDPKFKVLKNLRTYNSIVVKKKGMIKSRKALDYIGCSINELLNHLECQFIKCMSWDNYGVWEIDHIIPISIADSVEDVYKLNHYTNLQPLWKSDNVRKSNKF